MCWKETGGGAEARELAEKVSGAWVNFARTGNPNHEGLPAWPVFSPAEKPTMVFNRSCAVLNDPDREIREILSGA